MALWRPATLSSYGSLGPNELMIKLWLLGCSWSITCQSCFNYIFILDLNTGFNRLRKDNCKTRRERFQFCVLVRILLEVLRYENILVVIYITTPACRQYQNCGQSKCDAYLYCLNYSASREPKWTACIIFCLCGFCGPVNACVYRAAWYGCMIVLASKTLQHPRGIVRESHGQCKPLQCFPCRNITKTVDILFVVSSDQMK